MTTPAEIASIVEALHRPQFATVLANFLRTKLTCSHLLMLGCRDGKHPIYLYDAISDNRDYLFQRYLTDSYLNDPFYCHAQKALSGDILRLKDVLTEPAQQQDYKQRFCQQTGWYDELCFVTRLDQNRWILLFIGHRNESPARYQQNVGTLKELQPLLSALIRQQWADDHLLQSAAGAGIEGETAIEKEAFKSALNQAMASFGTALLTTKEREITLLILQGYDSQDIAALLQIALGTVKNHRKNIYRKLNVSSLSALHQLFMTHLLAS
jgi:DNA-binding CsgD family transcriptional regulator